MLEEDICEITVGEMMKRLGSVPKKFRIFRNNRCSYPTSLWWFIVNWLCRPKNESRLQSVNSVVGDKFFGELFNRQKLQACTSLNDGRCGSQI